MTEPKADSASIAVKSRNSEAQHETLERKRIEWAQYIHGVASKYNIIVRNLDQKSPSFEYKNWRVNIEHAANYRSVIFMWMIEGFAPAPTPHPNWTEVSASDRKQRWNYRRELAPHEFLGFLFELQECNFSVSQGRDRFEQAIRNAMSMPPTERTLKLNASTKSPRFYDVKTRVFARNPYVVAEVLIRAYGACEACGSTAPFRRRTDDSPYLEVHHRMF
jgi:hypothetical protein